jgi:hypothetical protein
MSFIGGGGGGGGGRRRYPLCLFHVVIKTLIIIFAFIQSAETKTYHTNA